MQIVGITGGIGSGKSTIARELAKQGFAVYDCDHEAKRIIAEDKNVKADIINLLGKEAFTPAYNTAYVAKRVFEDSRLLKALNAIIHPAVRRDIEKKHPDFVESAILYESGFDQLCKKVVVIDAPEEVRIARTIARDYKGIASPENINKVRARICAQHSTIPSSPHNILHLTNDGNTPIPDLVSIITHWM